MRQTGDNKTLSSMDGMRLVLEVVLLRQPLHTESNNLVE